MMVFFSILLIGFGLIWVGSNFWIAAGAVSLVLGLAFWMRLNLLNMHNIINKDLKAIWNKIPTK